MQAETIDSINADLTLFFSKTLKAEIVVPPGEVTKFLSSEVVKFFSLIKRIVPKSSPLQVPQKVFSTIHSSIRHHLKLL